MFLYRRTANAVSEETRPYFPVPAQVDVGFALDARSNDGVVPTLSQLYGVLGGVAVADHLDVVGMFRRGEDVPPGADAGVWNALRPGWLKSGSNFDEDRFQHLWDAIGAELLFAEGRLSATPCRPLVLGAVA